MRNKFQDDFRKDIISIKKSKNIYIFADKTNNLYETDISSYNKLLTESISKTYRKTNNKAYNSINKEAKAIAEGFEIGDRVDCLAKTNTFITLKDHKENFRSNPKCRLINPAKSEIGKVSELFIENINTKVRELSSVNQWRDSDAVINWFQNIKNKNKCIFIQFDIEEFYPSISKDLLLKAIDYAKGFVNISNDKTKTIMHSRKSLLFSGTDVWIKKDGDKDFDVTMGSYDGAEYCELVGLYILHKLGEKYGKERIGLYRDDGLACFENTSGPEVEKIRKAFIKLFKNEFSLNIVSDANIKVVNFLGLNTKPINW